MYEVHVHDEAQATVDVLPADAVAGYFEVLDLLSMDPWRGDPYRRDNPDGNIRTLPFAGSGFVTCMILDREQEVHLIEVLWLD
ncbi:MAG: hypothetical protein LC799_26535 [Actinobacteria bacterium]|nr:hypothetical protein [Actinomycetota bacterium]